MAGHISNVWHAMHRASHWLRRPARPGWVRLLLVSVLVAQGAIVAFDLGQAPAVAANPIQIENSNPGDPTWDDFASSGQYDAISGYGSQISVNRGGSIDFFVTTTAASFTIDIFRTGWYGGVGARKMTSLGTFPGVHQPIPPPDPVTGMIVCNWTKTTTMNVPATWTTGVYLAKLTASSGNKSFIFFVVRNDSGTEDLVFQTSVTTYQAYNAWGGTSLYENRTSSYKYPHATKVSFDRPFDPLDSNGAGHYLYYEYPFIRWAESQGFNLTYTTDIDTHTNANPLTNHRGFLSVGHDEYWSKGMRDNVQNGINAGVNAAFFSANTAYWQIRIEPSAAGVPNRIEVGYKDFATTTAAPGPDPQWNVNNAVVTTRWRDAPVSLPENGFIGVMYQDQVNQNYAYVVQNASHWVYAGTGFVDGSKVPGIVGYEYDKVWNNGATPAGLTILSSSPVVGCCENSGSSVSNATIYTASSGARVFAAGTIQWSWGLDNYSATYSNAGIKKTTSNILNNFIGAATPPTATPTNTLTATATSTPTNTPVPPTDTPAPPTNTPQPTNTPPPTNTTTATATSTPIPPPAAPSNLTATRTGQAIALKWTDNSANETGFSIQRATSADFAQNLVPVAAVAANTTSYRDTTAQAGTTYYYRVFAVNASGSSGPSNTASATMR